MKLACSGFLASLLAVAATLLPGLAAGAAQSIEDVFEVHRGSGPGSCDARRPLLDSTHFPEARALTQAALSAITNHKTSRPARDHLTAFFGIKFHSESNAPVDETLLGRVTDVYAKLQTLFNGEAQLPGGKPGLFCGSIKSADDNVASSDEGSTLPHSSARPDYVYVEEHADSSPDSSNVITTTIITTLSTVILPTSAPTEQPPPPPPPAATTTTITVAAAEASPTNSRPTPASQPAPAPVAPAPAAQFPPKPSSRADSELVARQSACRSSLRGFALTGPALTSVTLCPLAFDTTDRAPTLDAITVAQGKVLDECDARSQTLLHEGIHIMLRGQHSPDTAYGAARCLKLVADGRIDDALRNPDSFGFFALASWLSQKEFDGRHHRGTQRWQFHTGVATPQQQ